MQVERLPKERCEFRTHQHACESHPTLFLICNQEVKETKDF